MSEKFIDSSHLDVWEKAAAKQSPGGDVNNLVWNTPEGLKVKALYTKKDVDSLEFADTLPGVFKRVAVVRRTLDRISQRLAGTTTQHDDE